MIKIDALMERLLASAPDDGVPCLVGTITADGRPQISPKGSVAVFDDETLCYWERSFRTSYEGLQSHPQVVIYYRNEHRTTEMPYKGGALRFHGLASIATDSASRERAWTLMCDAEKERDPDKKGVVILVRLNLIEELTGKIVMERGTE